MPTPLSVLNLVHGGWRTILSVAGITIAIVLIFMQLGFLGAVTDTAVVFYDKMKFDLVACSPDYYNFVDCSQFPTEHLQTIASMDGVASVHPLHVSLGKWNYEDAEVQRGVLIIGVDPGRTTFREPELRDNVALVEQRGAVLVDRSTRPLFLGAANRTPFGDQHLGLQIELNEVVSKVAGFFAIGTGLAADGAVVVHEDQFIEMIPGYSRNLVSMGLVQLEPGADVEDIRDRILSRFPETETRDEIHHAVDVLTRNEVRARETRYWLRGTPVGFIFFTGSVVAFFVGAVIVYIVLSADITKQISEYATLKAMGYRNLFLSKTVLEQAFILAIGSYICAFVLSLILYQVVGDISRLPIKMTIPRQIIVFVSSLLMSFLSAMIAMQKLRQADPADLFQG